MSAHEFHAAVVLAQKQDTPFYALIMAAMMRADTPNLIKLQAAYPEIWKEAMARYHAPGGRLPED